MDEIVVFWFRRDLRLVDNAGLYHALKSGFPVLPLFIFDELILKDLPDKKDGRVEFIYLAIENLQRELAQYGSDIEVHHGVPARCFEQLTAKYSISAVYTNRDYEPYANERDTAIGNWLLSKGIGFHTFKDQVIFEKDEVLKDNGQPYTVFTPYSKKWKAKLDDFYKKPYPVGRYSDRFYKRGTHPLPTLGSLGFEPNGQLFPDTAFSESLVATYDQTRNFPGAAGTTRLSVHLRFGTISIRSLVQKAQSLNETFLNELIWREFYMMILWHFPDVAGRSFKKEYDNIVWRNNEAEFQQWCAGETGIPIVDAGMRELNETGYMHNRVRMIVASFLTKNLLIDWRWGEAYFAQKLLDFDLSANNGGWQWAAGSGCDAAPYFRVFNPTLQAEKFDPHLVYIRKWVPELDSFSYPLPMVDLQESRVRCLEAYKKGLGS